MAMSPHRARKQTHKQSINLGREQNNPKNDLHAESPSLVLCAIRAGLLTVNPPDEV